MFLRFCFLFFGWLNIFLIHFFCDWVEITLKHKCKEIKITSFSDCFVFFGHNTSAALQGVEIVRSRVIALHQFFPMLWLHCVPFEAFLLKVIVFHDNGKKAHSGLERASTDV